MIPAGMNPDGAAWWVGNEWCMSNPPKPSPYHLDRPCDTCEGLGELADTFEPDWKAGTYHMDPCPDCSGTGRHTFTIEVENPNLAPIYLGHPMTDELRVSVVPGMVLPIYDADDMEDGLPQEWMSHITIDSFNAAQRWWRDSKYPDEWADEDITLPPAAKPGMWAVKLAIHE